MKKHYKGFELEAKRDEPLFGKGTLVFCSAFRESDGWELASYPSYGQVRDEIENLTLTVDDYLKNPKDYEDETV